MLEAALDAVVTMDQEAACSAGTRPPRRLRLPRERGSGPGHGRPDRPGVAAAAAPAGSGAVPGGRPPGDPRPPPRADRHATRRDGVPRGADDHRVALPGPPTFTGSFATSLTAFAPRRRCSPPARGWSRSPTPSATDPAEPPRRRPAAADRGTDHARAAASVGRLPSEPSCSTRRSTSSPAASRTCASSPTGCTRRSWPSAVSPRRCRRSPCGAGHVELLALPDLRLPEPIEATAYYVVARRWRTSTSTRTRPHLCAVSTYVETALVEVTDDGVGGADDEGSGLRARRPRRGDRGPDRPREPARRRHPARGGDPVGHPSEEKT